MLCSDGSADKQYLEALKSLYHLMIALDGPHLGHLARSDEHNDQPPGYWCSLEKEPLDAVGCRLRVPSRCLLRVRMYGAALAHACTRTLAWTRALACTRSRLYLVRSRLYLVRYDPVIMTPRHYDEGS